MKRIVKRLRTTYRDERRAFIKKRWVRRTRTLLKLATGNDQEWDQLSDSALPFEKAMKLRFEKILNEENEENVAIADLHLHFLQDVSTFNWWEKHLLIVAAFFGLIGLYFPELKWRAFVVLILSLAVRFHLNERARDAQEIVNILGSIQEDQKKKEALQLATITP